MVIQSADKGGAVILDRHAYEAEIQRQLSVTTFYEKLKYNPVSSFKTSVYDSLKQLLECGFITKAEFEFMWVEHPVTPVLYTLPKIHKPYKDVPPGRPIVSAIGSLTEKISAFIDFFLQPLVCSLPSYQRYNGLH